MIALLDRLMHAVVANSIWVGPAFGLLAFGESLALVGVLIPATPALFFIGTLLGSEQVAPALVLPWMMAGAIGGYWLSWAAGRRLGPAVYRTYFALAHRRGIIRTRLFFRRWGGPSLVAGRFVLGPFQSLLPLVAGVAGMRARHFHLWNLGSSVSWVLIVLTPGYLAARGIKLLGFDENQQSQLILLLLVASGLLTLAAIGFAVLRFASTPRQRSRR